MDLSTSEHMNYRLARGYDIRFCFLSWLSFPPDVYPAWWNRPRMKWEYRVRSPQLFVVCGNLLALVSERRRDREVWIDVRFGLLLVVRSLVKVKIVETLENSCGGAPLPAKESRCMVFIKQSWPIKHSLFWSWPTWCMREARASQCLSLSLEQTSTSGHGDFLRVSYFLERSTEF